MKIDRVILALTDNSIYSGFWELVSEVWLKNFDITPTLFFYGDEDKFNSIPCDFGEKYHLNFIPDVCVNPKRDWACTWGLFYGASLFPDDTCMTCGIDQLPLSNLIFDELSKYYSEDKYLIGFADAYPQEHDWYVSSHHIAKGSLYKSILEIDDSWEKEAKKVFGFRHNYKLYSSSDFWGLDEQHSSYLLKNKENVIKVNTLFHNIVVPNRIDRSFLYNIDLDNLKSGNYSEMHCPRPFDQYADLLYLIKSNIPKYV